MKCCTQIKTSSSLKKAIENLPQHVAQGKIGKVLKKNQSQIRGLAEALRIKLNGRVMLTVKTFCIKLTK